MLGNRHACKMRRKKSSAVRNSWQAMFHSVRQNATKSDRGRVGAGRTTSGISAPTPPIQLDSVQHFGDDRDFVRVVTFSVGGCAAAEPLRRAPSSRPSPD